MNIKLTGCYLFKTALVAYLNGDHYAFFKAINGYRAYTPTPWDKNLWIEFINRYE